MYSFNNDYSEIAHPFILRAFTEAGLEQNNGYGIDEHCQRAASLIKDRINCQTADIHFLPGGTVTNTTFISHILRPYEAVISASFGHINVHETGAIESSGHKVLTAHAPDGKLTPELIEPLLLEHSDEHMVSPGMVYISNPTEIGTIYSKQELTVLSDYCKEKGLVFYLDGARLSMALTSSQNDLSFEDLPNLLDAFYIGGTKVGAMFGEALVLVNEKLQKDFRFSIKQRGAMTAKGFLLGVQFEQLFDNNLYLTLGRHANEMALLLQNTFVDLGYSFLTPSATNQIFPILPDTLIDQITQNYVISTWERIDDQNCCVRFVTSWATDREEVLKFIEFFKAIHVKGR